jgi:FxsC-like protein
MLPQALEGGRVHRPNMPADAAVPYFFLSYPRTPQIDARDSADPDMWVAQLFSDLCADVQQLADLPKNTIVGFMDREALVGGEWHTEMAQALATCSVFVPLYSLQYFADEHCGREWSFFARRARNRTERIVPAVWRPVDKRLLPAVAQQVRWSRGGNEAYESRGFYGIMKVSRYRNDYRAAVYDLACQIVTTDKRSPVPKGPPVEYRGLENAFGVVQGRVLRITVVAPKRGDLPSERSETSYYGPSAQGWNPYAPVSEHPIAAEAARLARGHRDRFQVEVGDLCQHEADLLSGNPPAGPQVLLIDPWALFLPHYQNLLQRLDALDAPWVQTMVLLSDSDEESQEHARKLRATRNDVLGRKLATASSGAAREVGSLAHFRSVLPGLIDAAAQGFRRRAPTFPPTAGPAVERPNLLGYTPGSG